MQCDDHLILFACRNITQNCQSSEISVFSHRLPVGISSDIHKGPHVVFHDTGHLYGKSLLISVFDGDSIYRMYIQRTGQFFRQKHAVIVKGHGFLGFSVPEGHKGGKCGCILRHIQIYIFLLISDDSFSLLHMQCRIGGFQRIQIRSYFLFLLLSGIV